MDQKFLQLNSPAVAFSLKNHSMISEDEIFMNQCRFIERDFRYACDKLCDKFIQQRRDWENGIMLQKAPKRGTVGQCGVRHSAQRYRSRAIRFAYSSAFMPNSYKKAVTKVAGGIYI